MNRLTRESLNSVIKKTSGGKRPEWRIISLAGVLNIKRAPDAVQHQLATRSRLPTLQNAFDALLEPLTLLARSSLDSALQYTLVSLKGTRQQIADLDEINYSLLIGWPVSAAEARQLLRVRRGSRK